MTRVCIRALAVALLATANAVFAQTPKPLALGVTPVHLELSAQPGSVITQAVRVYSESVGDNINVTLGDFNITPNGEGQYFKAGVIAQSAAKWFTVTPVVFALPPKGSVETSFTIRVPNDPTLHGSYWGMVFFNTSPRPSNGGQVNLAVTGRIGVAVYINVGSGIQKAQAGNLKFDVATRTLNYTFQNQGDTLLRPAVRLALVGADGKRFASLDLDDFPILPGGVHLGSFQLPAAVQLPSGSFLAVLTFEYGDHKLIAAQGAFKAK